MSKLLVFSALALFLMVADVRLRITQPVRAVLAQVLYPAQWLVLQPVAAVRGAGGYLQSLQSAQRSEQALREKLGMQSQKANQVEQLLLENRRLRQLVELRERVSATGQLAQVLYDSADPFSRKIVLDKGLDDGIEAGSPVIDEGGVLGQVTRVYPAVSEVTLLTDRDQAIPVLNTRTGARGLAFGDPSLASSGLELRFMAANADVQPGDVLATSGVDGVYPPGLPVAKVDKVERRNDTAFARIALRPMAMVEATAHVIVLQPVSAQIPPRPVAAPEAPVVRKGARP